MGIRTGEEYIQSLRGRKMKVYLFGEIVEEPVDHPLIRPSINAVAETYDLAVREEELDMNPVLVMEKGQGCKILDVRIGL